ncbi:MAG: alpha/beta hydrolase [Lachnospiraceae bacterium]|nr:alpha/beta hydrolase [Lachnospiraceae bacterium]
MKIAALIVVILVVLILAAGYALMRYAMGIPRQSLEDARKWQEDHYDLSWYDGLAKEDYTVKSYDGYVLHAQFLKNPVTSDRYVLISHGYTDNHFGSLKYTKMYLDLGFNVIIYDLRGHGANEITFCTYSVRESRDLIAMIEDSRRRFPEMSVFGIQGESLGSATSAACLKYRPQIDFVVADCGFSEIISVMKGGLKAMHLPGFLVSLASFWAAVLRKYSFRKMRPIDSLPENEIPILFIHGGKDDFIIPQHSFNMSKATKGYSEVCIIPGAEHANSVLTAPEDYKNRVEAFLKKTGSL